MRGLAKLNPRWLGVLRPVSGEGRAFDCPNCGPRHTIAVYFANPLDGKEPAPWQKPVWNRDGETFQTLSIQPSISYPCFHGWVEGGFVIDISESPATAMVMVGGKLQRVALSPAQYRNAVEEPSDVPAPPS